ncbi:GAF domain-containing protein [Streptomyces sp. NPDC046759]|uniref:GAF domain-containing protein n=1 Tax=Streptomyces sp. NPDC046759 TaxID=3155019 RepID=UPI0033F16A1E
MTVSYRAVGPQPVGRVSAAERAEQLATYVALALDAPSALRRVLDATAELGDAPHLAAVLPRLARTAIAVMGADFGNIQVMDPIDGSLVLVNQSGFGTEFLDHFAVVRDDRSVCARAAGQGAQTVVADVRADPGLAPHEKVFRAAGVRAVQSTPLVDLAGRLVGMVSTHMRDPGQPSELPLRIMRLLCLLAGESLSRHLRGPRVDGEPADLRQHDTAGTWPGPDKGPSDPAMARFMSETINRIFSAGLNFAGALPGITDGVASQRVEAGIDDLDAIIRSMQRAALGLADHDGTRPSGTPRTVMRRGSPSGASYDSSRRT